MTLKLYMYIGILLGAAFLAGCNANGQADEQGVESEEITEDKANGKVLEVESLNDNEVLATVIPLDLTQAQKEEYYKQYSQIIKDVNSENNSDLELVPFEDFGEEDWVELGDFRQIAYDIANAEFTPFYGLELEAK